ncbi:hypothetical protein [Kitasatospora sp. GP82]|uniref:hypothetical protein n=1 Tax=Kitasatospora sp. GP82 TaxID=3035089 RepID=UPI002476EBC6|nr:hypothetical protein [Kitasatospora sp. GP82]MDH6126947.1 hypothetical protein [Kitasatospora sp. GP82]
MNLKLTTLAVLACAALTAGTVGCGDRTPAAVGISAAASASPTPNGVEKLPPKDIVTASINALKQGQAAHVNGRLDDGTVVVTLDLSMDVAGDCTGSVGVTSLGTFQLIKVGDQLWIKPDQAFWQNHGGAAASALIGDRYLKTTSANPDYGVLGSVCDLSALADSLNPQGVSLSGGPQSTVNGTPAATVLGAKGPEKGTLAVAMLGSPYPLHFDRAGGVGGETLDFKDFTVPVSPTTPRPDQSIDVDQLGQLTSPGASPTSV